MSDATSSLSLSSLVPPFWLSGDSSLVPSATYSDPSGAPTVQISQDEYNRLRQLEFSHTGIHQLIHPLQIWMFILLLLTDLTY